MLVRTIRGNAAAIPKDPWGYCKRNRYQVAYFRGPNRTEHLSEVFKSMWVNEYHPKACETFPLTNAISDYSR